MKLLKLDDVSIKKHHDLTSGDRCYYWRDYTVGKGFSYGETNDLISNFKIKPTETKRLPHKNSAIQIIAREFSQIIPEKSYKNCIFIPVPPSKSEVEEDYDDRLVKVLKLVSEIKNTPIEIRNLIKQSQSTAASHAVKSGQRVTVDELLNIYIVESSLIKPKPKSIIIFDDVLTKGSHFRAMKMKLESYYIDIPTVGLFVARSINEEINI